MLSLKADNNSDVGEDVFEESEVVNEERIGKVRTDVLEQQNVVRRLCVAMCGRELTVIVCPLTSLYNCFFCHPEKDV